LNDCVAQTLISRVTVDNPSTWKTFLSCRETKPMDDLEGLAAFVAVVETGGFAAAGRRLGVTTSAVSKQVGKLEARLRARLLQRSTRKLSLTEAGAAFMQHARRALAEAEAAREAVVDLNAVPRGLLRLTAPLGFGIMHVSPAITPFLTQHPEMRVDMVLDDRILDLVQDGFDMAIRCGSLAGASMHLVRRLATQGVVVCASPAYLARRGEPRTPADLAAHDTLVHPYYPEGDSWQFTGPTGPVTVELKPRYSSNNALALRAAALDGGGIVRLASFFVSDDLAAGRLVRVLTRWRLPGIEIHAVYPNRAYVPLKARAFTDFLLGRFADASYWKRVA
jgi:DNA-binding transcriptional LysR family regulator